MEAIAAPAAQLITDVLKIPTIGIGSGSGTSAQLVVQSEVLGYQTCFLQKWHTPFAEIGKQSLEGLRKFKEETQGKRFPTGEQSYVMKEGEERVLGDLRKRAREMMVYENMTRERRGSKSSY